MMGWKRVESGYERVDIALFMTCFSLHKVDDEDGDDERMNVRTNER